ncbi:hypothetical protein GN244_ATG04321 [Phytophthora infestans]|uniref:RxLR effector protein n=1 Tax=Phytophthora infestans TaxID=4787 RepID=A0A833T4I3_PHYIN|nr:hypothetical protein GN244_ATG04321 [Phytophthora infestans]
MRQGIVSFVVIVLLAGYVAASPVPDSVVIDSVKTRSYAEPPETVTNTNHDVRILRNRVTNAAEEERAGWGVSKFLASKWQSLTGKSLHVKDVKRDFAMIDIANMLQSSTTRRKMFKKWNKYSIPDLRTNIGDDTLKQPRVAKMFEKYIRRRKDFKTPVAS